MASGFCAGGVPRQDEDGTVVTMTIELRFICSDAPLADNPLAGLVPLYRLYNPYDGQHLLTIDYNEYEELEKQGWQQEGVASYQREVELEPNALALSDPKKASGEVVYGLYNSYNGDHLYTTLMSEVEGLVRLDWRFEGAVFEGALDEDENSTPVYRLYNPYMTLNGGVGSHLYTADYNEYTTLSTLGWLPEEVYWHASAPSGAARR